jgi:phosphoglycolate phosphatase-like HAD superfamily hydrolase
VPLKPDPAVALAIAEKFGLPPSRVAYVGDSLVDMRLATAAGMVAGGLSANPYFWTGVAMNPEQNTAAAKSSARVAVVFRLPRESGVRTCSPPVLTEICVDCEH